MKKLLLLICIFTLLIPCLGGCKRVNEGLKVVVTAYAPYDLLTELVGDSGIEVIFLSEDGADPHSFQPTAEDFVNIYSADLFIYLSDEAEPWCKDAAEICREEGGATLALVEEALQGSEHEGGHEGHDHGADEHVWLSPELTENFCIAMTEELCIIDEENAELYRGNLSQVQGRLKALDKDYRNAVGASKKNTVVIADRFPFTYLFEEYGIESVAAFPGCSAETEASFDTVMELINTVKGEELPYVLVTETSDGALARTVCEESGGKCEILTLYSIQVKSDKGYFDLMEENLEILRKALG